MSHHDINIIITVAPKNPDSQEREFRPTLPAPSLGQLCGMILRDIYLRSDASGEKLDMKVLRWSKLGPPILKDYNKSHSGTKKNTLPKPSLDQVFNRLFEYQKGQWKQRETSLSKKPTGGVVTGMSVPQKRGLSHHFEPDSYFLEPYEENTFYNSYGTSLRPGSSTTTNR